MKSIGVLFEVANERGRQDEKWGGPTHDDRHQTAEFAEFIEQRAYKVRAFLGTCAPEHNELTRFGFGTDTPRGLLIEIAALAVAAVESIDRKLPNDQHNRTPDQGVPG